MTRTLLKINHSFSKDSKFSRDAKIWRKRLNKSKTKVRN